MQWKKWQHSLGMTRVGVIEYLPLNPRIQEGHQLRGLGGGWNWVREPVFAIYPHNHQEERCGSHVTHTFHQGDKVGFELWYHSQNPIMDFPHTTVFMRCSKLCVFCNSTFIKSQFIVNSYNSLEQNNILKLNSFISDSWPNYPL